MFSRSVKDPIREIPNHQSNTVQQEYGICNPIMLTESTPDPCHISLITVGCHPTFFCIPKPWNMRHLNQLSCIRCPIWSKGMILAIVHHMLIKLINWFRPWNANITSLLLHQCIKSSINLSKASPHQSFMVLKRNSGTAYGNWLLILENFHNQILLSQITVFIAVTICLFFKNTLDSSISGPPSIFIVDSNDGELPNK